MWGGVVIRLSVYFCMYICAHVCEGSLWHAVSGMEEKMLAKKKKNPAVKDEQYDRDDFCELYLFHYKEAMACLSALSIMTAEMLVHSAV